jgi:hypothetical protein
MDREIDVPVYPQRDDLTECRCSGVCVCVCVCVHTHTPI